jgi:hypothetical protein
VFGGGGQIGADGAELGGAGPVSTTLRSGRRWFCRQARRLRSSAPPRQVVALYGGPSTVAGVGRGAGASSERSRGRGQVVRAVRGGQPTCWGSHRASPRSPMTCARPGYIVHTPDLFESRAGHLVCVRRVDASRLPDQGWGGPSFNTSKRRQPDGRRCRGLWRSPVHPAGSRWLRPRHLCARLSSATCR